MDQRHKKTDRCHFFDADEAANLHAPPLRDDGVTDVNARSALLIACRSLHTNLDTTLLWDEEVKTSKVARLRYYVVT